MPVVLLLFLLLAGCAGQPPVRELSHMLPAAESPLGRQVQALAAGQPAGHSGFGVLGASLDAFEARTRLIRAAQRSLDLQYYIVADGLTTRVLLDELLQAADRGVRIRALFDDLASDGHDALAATLAQHPNIEVRLFNPVHWGRALAPGRLLARAVQLPRQHRRMHNKVLLADSSLAVVGGRNLGDEYFAADQSFNFADLDLIAAGPVAAQLGESFDLYWNHRLAVPIEALARAPAGDALRGLRERLDSQLGRLREEQPERYAELAAYLADPAIDRLLGGLIWAPGRAFWDHPDKLLARGRPPLDLLMARELLPLLEAADDELMMVSAYFVPTARGTDWLIARVQAGAAVRVLTNSLEATDVPAVHGGYTPYRKRLLEAGVELYELRPRPGQQTQYSFDGDSDSSLHSKALVLDGQRVFIGSANFDPRSVLWNSEVGILVDSEALAAQVNQLIREGMQAAVSYRVSLLEHDGERRLLWSFEENGRQQVLTREPGSAWRRFNAWFARVFGLESLL